LIESKRFLIVGLLSSAANTPFCFATMALATDLSSSMFMSYSFSKDASSEDEMNINVEILT
jgi:hypothetical protein